MAFADDLHKFNLEVEKYANQDFRSFALKAYQLVLKRTPVLTGTAKGNWRVSLDSPDYTYEKLERPIDNSHKGNETINNATVKNDIYISNSVPYILRLENGYSRQAPEGMVAITVEEMQRYARKK